MPYLYPSFVISVLLAASFPDLVPRDLKAVTVESRLEVAPWAERVCRQVVIKEGDTLARLAKAIGGEQRVGEITALNPGVEPTRLKIGQAIWLPPTQPLPAGTEPLFLFAGLMAHNMVRIAPVRFDDATLQLVKGGVLQVYLVPQKHLVAMQEALAGRQVRDALAAVVKLDGVAEGHCQAVGHFVERDSKATKRTDVYRMENQAGAVKLVQVSSELTDADGKKVEPKAAGNKSNGPVPKQPGREAGKEPGKEEDALLLLLLAAGGGALLAMRARRGAVVLTGAGV